MNIADFYVYKKNVIVHCRNKQAQLFDFQNGHFYSLDLLGWQMLSSVLEVGFQKTLIALQHLYNVEPDRLEQDLHDLLKELTDYQLIVPVDRNDSAKIKVGDQLRPIMIQILRFQIWLIRKLINPGTEPSVITVNLLLLLSWLSFRYLNWGTNLELWQQWHPQEMQTDLNPDQTQQILTKVDRLIRTNAAGSFFFPMVCKERALVGYHLLRVFYRLPVQLVIGTALYPLQVHAWVAYQGQIITDDPEHCAYFDPIITYPDDVSFQSES